MYRIELAPGEETVFRTIEELAVAVRNGLVTPRCRIYHNATQKWLPIEFHPHYKQALSLPAARIAEAVAPRSSGHPPRLETLSFAVAPVAKPMPAPEPLAEPAPEAGADRSDAEHSTKKHSATEPAGVEHSGAPSVPEHPVPKHPAMDHPPTGHSAADRAVTTHLVVLHTAADEAVTQAAVEHPVREHPSAAASPTKHPVIESPSAAYHFASRADMAAAPSIDAEPAPAANSRSSYRPDSYLPPPARVIADDPYVAAAAEPPAAPFVPAPPRTSWTMMPAVEKTPELPTISYPEITPAEEPVAERASSSRGHRPLQVAVALLVLAAGGYLARSFYSPVQASDVDNSSMPAATVAERPALPEDAPVPPPSAATTKPSPSRPTVVTPAAPASSGFAAALEPRAIATGPAPILPVRVVGPGLSSVASTADSSGVTGPIAPAPAEMQMDVPALPGGDSLVAQPRSKSDSAMKRILRAVTSGKDAQ